MVPTLVIISIVSFVIIQLPPGDYLTSYIAALEATGQSVNQEQVEQLRARYHLDQPLAVQYLKWAGGLLKGDLGTSFEWNRPVRALIGERLALTAWISFATLLFIWVLAIPIGVFSAVKKDSWGDHFFTFAGFVGLAVPSFLLALIFMYVGVVYFGVTPGGLMSPEFVDQPWSFAKVADFLGHLWVPVVVIGLSGTAAVTRILRANLLDELEKPYVLAARAKGLPEWKVILKYPLRVALIPLISTIGWLLPVIVSGEVIVSIVLGLQTIGPLLLRALLNQDMYLAGGIVMMLSLLTIVGTLISDLLLMWLDPRIRTDES